MGSYTTKSGDTWDMIARTVYGDENRMSELMTANPAHIGTFLFQDGIVLNVPEIPESKRATNKPIWRDV